MRKPTAYSEVHSADWTPKLLDASCRDFNSASEAEPRLTPKALSVAVAKAAITIAMCDMACSTLLEISRLELLALKY